MKHFILPLLSALAVPAAIQAQTSVFYSPVSITSPNSNAYYDIANLYQGAGVGFDAAEPHNVLGNEGDGSFLWVTEQGGGDYYDGFSAPVLIIDLGEDRLLTEISVWSYSSVNTNGAKDFSLRFATDAEGAEGFSASIPYNPSFETLFDPVLRDSNPFSQSVTARFVEMTVTDNWQGFQAFPGGDRVGAGEIAFAVVPEPSAALLGAGACAGMLLRRRRTATA